jgi:CheY-like chemotaxis protein
MLIKEALRECHQEIEINIVTGSHKLPGYLDGRIGDGLPNLILMDIHMLRVDGLEVLREIKTHRRLRGIPVVGLTGLTRDTDINRASPDLKLTSATSWTIFLRKGQGMILLIH